MENTNKIGLLIDLDKNGDVVSVKEEMTLDKPFLDGIRREGARYIADVDDKYALYAQMNAAAARSFQFYGDGGLGSIWQRGKR